MHGENAIQKLQTLYLKPVVIFGDYQFRRVRVRSGGRHGTVMRERERAVTE